MVPIYKGKGDVMNCKAYKGVKLVEHGMKIVERVLKKKMKALMEMDDMQFGFMPGRGMTNVFYSEKNARRICGRRIKSCTCVLWI